MSGKEKVTRYLVLIIIVVFWVASECHDGVCRIKVSNVGIDKINKYPMSHKCRKGSHKQGVLHT